MLWIDQTEKISRRANLKKSSPTRLRRDSPGEHLQSNDLKAISRSPSPFSTDTYITFTAKHLFGHGADGPEHDYELWISSIIQDDSNQVSYTALKCLATTYFGRIQRRPDVLRKGTTLYGKALHQLRDSLEDETTAYHCRNLAATMALVYYETIAYTYKYGWIQHAGGTSRLIEMRGPERHQDEPDHTYFLLSRFRITVQAIMSRQRVFLERSEWQTVPWAKHPATKTPTDDLIDILTHVPSILAEFDRLTKLAGVSEGEGGQWHLSRRSQGPEQDAWEVARGRVVALLQRLEQWRQLWQTRHTTLYVEEKAPNPLTSLTWDHDLQYPAKVTYYATFTTAHEVALYIIALALLGSLSSFLRDRQDICRQVLGTDHLVDRQPQQGASTGVENDEDAGSSSEDQQQQQHQKKTSSVLPHVGMLGVHIFHQATGLLDYLLLEQHRGKGAFTAMVILRIW